MAETGKTSDLGVRVIRRAVVGTLVLAALVFVPAWTLAYWQGWLFLAVFVATSAAFTVYLAWRDPAALERRMRAGPRAETATGQKWAISAVSIGAIAMVVLPPLDYRFGWSNVPAALSVVGDVLVAVSFLLFALVMRENSFAAATVQVGEGQRVISTGPYAIVRHPMYTAGLLLLVGTPLALGSWWSLLIIALVLPALIWRLIDEEQLLARELQGYAAYMRQVRWRLVPGVY